MPCGSSAEPNQFKAAALSAARHIVAVISDGWGEVEDKKVAAEIATILEPRFELMYAKGEIAYLKPKGPPYE